MYALIPIVAILAVFGVPAYMFKRAMDYKERKLELQASEASEANKQLVASNEERAQLLERLEILEAIVHDGDYELNRQIKLVAKAEEQKRLDAASEEH